MYLEDYYRDRRHEHFSGMNPFYWFLSKEAKGSPDNDGLHIVFGFISILYWVTLPIWVWAYLRSEWRCLRTGHQWSVGEEDPPVYAKCLCCGIDRRTEINLQK